LNPQPVLTEVEQQVVLKLLAQRLDLTEVQAESVLKVARLKRVSTGHILFEQGQGSSSFYLVLAGRLRGQRRGARGIEVDVWFQPGDIIGELGFFDQSLRTLTASASRESLLLEIDQLSLAQCGESSVLVYQHILKVLIKRFKNQMGYERSTLQAPLIWMQNWIQNSDFAVHAERELRGGLSRKSKVDFLHNANEVRIGLSSLAAPAHGPQVFVSRAGELCPERLLDDLDAAVFLVDLPLLRDDERRALLMQAVLSVDEGVHVWIVHMHPEGHVHPGHLKAFKGLARPSVRHLHVRNGQEIDLDRVARHLLGRTFTLVFGGGGAKGFAHAGVYRALAEAGLMPDSVGGTSMGALVGALVATGKPPAEVEEILKTTFKGGLPFRWRDYLFPKHGFIRSNSVNNVYHKAFGEDFIEDLPVPFFAVGCNLSTGLEDLIDQGLVWKAIRASTSIPVLFEPYLDKGQVLVDGALVNNVPVDRMRSRGGRYVVTVDVGQEEDIRARGKSGEVVMPSMLRSLMRMVELGGLQKSRVAQHNSDFFLQPEVNSLGMLDFHKADQIIQIGYECAQQWIPKIRSMVHY
jgi:NTE family protein